MSESGGISSATANTSAKTYHELLGQLMRDASPELQGRMLWIEERCRLADLRLNERFLQACSFEQDGKTSAAIHEAVESNLLDKFDVIAGAMLADVSELKDLSRFNQALASWIEEVLPSLEHDFESAFHIDTSLLAQIKDRFSELYGHWQGHMTGSVDRIKLAIRMNYWKSRALAKVRERLSGDGGVNKTFGEGTGQNLSTPGIKNTCIDPFGDNGSRTPLGDNPFTEKDPLHGIFEQITWEAEAEVAKLRLKVFRLTTQDASELLRSVLTFRLTYFELFASLSIRLVKDERTARWYEVWIAEFARAEFGHVWAWAQQRADKFNLRLLPSLKPEVLGVIYMQKVEEYKSRVALKIADPLQQRCSTSSADKTPTTDPSSLSEISHDEVSALIANNPKGCISSRVAATKVEAFRAKSGKNKTDFPGVIGISPKTYKNFQETGIIRASLLKDVAIRLSTSVELLLAPE